MDFVLAKLQEIFRWPKIKKYRARNDKMKKKQ